jgi:mono/diheme cytochrome c family protein
MIEVNRRIKNGLLAVSVMLCSFVAQAETDGSKTYLSTPESVQAGAQIYLNFCTACHGKDGRALMDVISDATDLTDPDAYYNGSTREDIFRSISEGAGVGMPPWKSQFKDEKDIWHLVNFIQSLWTIEQRSAL